MAETVMSISMHSFCVCLWYVGPSTVHFLRIGKCKEKWYNFSKVVRIASGEGNREKITNKYSEPCDYKREENFRIGE